MSLLGRGQALDIAVLMSGDAGYKSRKAVDFDGIDDYVDVGTPATLNNLPAGEFTIGAWIYPHTAGESNQGRIIDKRGGGRGWAFGTFLVSGSNTKLILYVERSTTDMGATTDDYVVPFNEWSFVAVTLDGALASNLPIFYVNAVVVANSAGSPAGTYQDDSGQTFQIGNNSTTTLTFDGLIDDLFIADRILTPTEITEAYNDGSPIDITKATFASDVVAFWKMGDGDTYPTLEDSVGSADGTMTNMTPDAIVAGVNG